MELMAVVVALSFYIGKSDAVVMESKVGYRFTPEKGRVRRH
jgi:hypothetical protein